jgi:hypothetical protein
MSWSHESSLYKSVFFDPKRKFLFVEPTVSITLALSSACLFLFLSPPFRPLLVNLIPFSPLRRRDPFPLVVLNLRLHIQSSRSSSLLPPPPPPSSQCVHVKCARPRRSHHHPRQMNPRPLMARLIGLSSCVCARACKCE